MSRPTAPSELWPGVRVRQVCQDGTDATVLVVPVLSGHGVKIAPSTYYAARSRAPSARAVRDGQLLPETVIGSTPN